MKKNKQLSTHGRPTPSSNPVQRKRLLGLFAKAFGITFMLLMSLGVIAYSVIDHTVQAPAPPALQVMSLLAYAEELPQGDETEAPEDTLSIPQTLQFEERRDNFFTFLLVGLTEGYGANTVMVASYDADTREAHLISIPRDTRVDFNRNNRKLVAAYQVGRLHGGGHAGGIARLKQEVATLIGFVPDFYIRIDYDAFERIIDSVGGIEVYVPFHMRWDDPLQNLHINIPAGQQTLDGRNALHFARHRNANPGFRAITDYQRMENQQLVINQLASQLLTPASLLRIPTFVEIFQQYFDTDLDLGALMWFANQARGIGDLSNLNMHTLPMGGTSGAPAWYEFADPQAVLTLINATVNPMVRPVTLADVRIITH